VGLASMGPPLVNGGNELAPTSPAVRTLLQWGRR